MPLGKVAEPQRSLALGEVFKSVMISSDGNSDNESGCVGTVLCRGTADALLRMVSMRVSVLGLVLILGIICWSNKSFAQPLPEPEVYDFRKKPIIFLENIKEFNLTPKVDKLFVVKKIRELMRSISHGSLKGNPFFQVSKTSQVALTYHAVIRYELAQDRWIDRHISTFNKVQEQSKLGGDSDDEVYNKSIDRVITERLEKLASVSSLQPVSEPNDADILIYINLSERSQTSAGFNYELMPKYTQRKLLDKDVKNIRMLEYALPWTFARLYLPKKGASRSVLGGEIWIELPRRTFWQSELARSLLGDLSYYSRFGLGETRKEVVAGFRVPHKSELKALSEVLRLLLQSQSQPGGRPQETLLSFAVASLMIQPSFDAGSCCIRNLHCGLPTLSKTIAGRLARALTMFVGGMTANAVLISEQGDYSNGIGNNRDAFLADLSLVNYTGTFDQRLDDELAYKILEAKYEMEEAGVSLRTQPPWDVVFDWLTSKENKIAETYTGIATEFAYGQGCLTSAFILNSDLARSINRFEKRK